MDSWVFSLVLAAAAMHAGWNALVKVGLDRLSSITLIALCAGMLSLVALAFVSPPGPSAWPWMALSVVLHIGYNLFLVQAYRGGDLGQVYPIARGTAPLLVTLVSLAALNEGLAHRELLGIALLVAGIWLMALWGGRAGHVRLARRALACALTTSLFIAGYTLADGIGARVNHDPLGYTLWLFAINGLAMLIVFVGWRGAAAMPTLLAHWRGGLAGGAMSLGAYGITIWAMSMAPIALVAALRESSVLFALAISALLLGEPLSRGRLLAGLLIVSGIVITRLG